jgi:F-type H+-transporting ATPase subunit b
VLRLDWNIVFNIINLLILYFLMKRFLFKPINEILAKRQNEAEDRFALADQKEAKAMECQTKYETLLQDAKGEKEKIVAQARQEASDEYGRIMEEAKEKANGIVEKAKLDAQKEKEVILQQADSEIKDIVLSAAAKMVGTVESAQNDSALYDRFIENTKMQSARQNGE